MHDAQRHLLSTNRCIKQEIRTRDECLRCILMSEHLRNVSILIIIQSRCTPDDDHVCDVPGCGRVVCRGARPGQNRFRCLLACTWQRAAQQAAAQLWAQRPAAEIRQRSSVPRTPEL